MVFDTGIQPLSERNKKQIGTNQDNYKLPINEDDQSCDISSVSNNASDIHLVLEDTSFTGHQSKNATKNLKTILQKSIVKVQIIQDIEKKGKKKVSLVKPNPFGFVVRIEDLISREKDVMCCSSGLNSLIESKELEKDFFSWNVNGLILKKVRAMILKDMSKQDESATNALNDNIHSQRIPVKKIYSITLNPVVELKTNQNVTSFTRWSAYLTDCIRTYYNTGRIRISKQYDPKHIILALHYFGIECTSHEYVFDSIDCCDSIPMKSWMKYLQHRNEMANMIIRRLQSSRSNLSISFYISPVPIEGKVSVESNECYHFDGEFDLIPNMNEGIGDGYTGKIYLCDVLTHHYLSLNIHH